MRGTPGITRPDPTLDLSGHQSAPSYNGPSQDSSWEPGIRSDFFKLLYAGTLQQLSSRHTREFWTMHPLSLGTKKYQDKELLEFFWNSNSLIPLSYASNVLSSLEFNLCRSGSTIDQFFTTLFSSITSGSLLPSAKLLTVSKDLLETFSLAPDLQSHILRHLHKISRYLAPDSPHRLLRINENEGILNAIMLLIPDRRTNRHPGIDPFLWAGRITQLAPLSLGLQPFDSVQLLADMRHIREILVGGEDARLGGKDIVLTGKINGKTISFHDFCAEHSIKLSRTRSPDCPVFQVSSDYICPVRKRVVLHAGCCYGAPAHLYAISYSKKSKPVFFQTLIRNFLHKEKTIWEKLETEHQKTASGFRKELEFKMEKRDDTLTVNNRYLARGIPARILSRMVRKYVDDRNAFFCYKDFLHDRDVITEPSNPNLTIRFQRIALALSKKVPELTLEKAGRGKMRLSTAFQISYTETN